MRKVNLSPAFLLIAIALLFWTVILKLITGELPPLVSLLAIASLLIAIYTEMYYANRK